MTSPSSPDPRPLTPDPSLPRTLTLSQATALNVANMVGIGPFITIPIFLAKMGGPHAMIGWVIAAVVVICDGLVWSELGAALPGSGGSYHYLRETFGRTRWGRIVPFLFIWQFLISGTLELASGYVGAATFLTYVVPALKPPDDAPSWACPLNWLAAGAALAITALAARRTAHVGRLAVFLCAGTIVTVLTIIVSGLIHFDASKLTIPAGAWTLDKAFATGLAAAMAIAVYDYLGYYNICHLGAEVRDPGKTIPRAILLSVLIVVGIYLTMNVCLIAVVPWQEAIVEKTLAHDNIAAVFMERLYGREAAWLITVLILWTALAGTFAMTAGYSRIPFAAARNGDFFRVFGRLHPTANYPWVSLWAIGGLTAVFCFFPLQVVISAAVTARIAVPFISQIAAVHLLRRSRPDVAMPFRMWLYPVPSFVALVGWLFILVGSSLDKEGAWNLAVAAAVLVSGCTAFALRSWFANNRAQK